MKDSAAATTTINEVAGRVVATPPPVGASPSWQTAVENARARATAVKGLQDETAAAMAVGTIAAYALPIVPKVDNIVADLFLSALLGGGILGFVAGFREDAAGDAARRVGRTAADAASQVSTKVRELDSEYGVSESIRSKLPGEGGQGLSMADIKKYGVAGTLAYILTELAFWVVAFPVASTTFYNTAGHWPDLGDGGDRAAVLAFIFAGANVARLAVPLRFGAAFALAPWVDENIVKKLGIGGGDEEAPKTKDS